MPGSAPRQRSCEAGEKERVAGGRQAEEPGEPPGVHGSQCEKPLDQDPSRLLKKANDSTAFYVARRVGVTGDYVLDTADA